MAAHLMHMAWIRMIEEQMARGAAPKPIPSPTPEPEPEPVPPTPPEPQLPYIILRFQNTDVVPPPLNETYVDMFSYEKIQDGQNTWKLKQTDENLTDWSNLLYNSLLLEDVGEVDILEINFANKITNAASLFQNDSGLHTVQNILNADSIENMTNAFSKSGLIELPDLILPNCDTIYVLCDGCQELTKAGNIHIGRGAGNFNYSVSYLFRNCSKLKSVGNIIWTMA